MKNLFLVLIVLLLTIPCTAQNKQESSSDLKHLAFKPFRNILDAVLVYQHVYNEFPSEFNSLTKLTREEWIDACRFEQPRLDTLIIPRVDYYSEEETKLEEDASGLKIRFSLTPSDFNVEYEEKLWSKAFEGIMLMRYNIFIAIEEGNGVIEISKENKYQGKLTLKNFKARLLPDLNFGGVPKQIQIDNLTNESIEVPYSECIETKK